MKIQAQKFVGKVQRQNDISPWRTRSSCAHLLRMFYSDIHSLTQEIQKHSVPHNYISLIVFANVSLYITNCHRHVKNLGLQVYDHVSHQPTQYP